ncbi:hypothetical protein ABLT31_22235 [Ammoniphilus sp. 3BR4]
MHPNDGFCFFKRHKGVLSSSIQDGTLRTGGIRRRTYGIGALKGAVIILKTLVEYVPAANGHRSVFRQQKLRQKRVGR